ncbi:MAG: hypothetical protein N3A68_03655 [Bacteroidia bacterium]|jgi:hypothetical protein|nr:hypothetical protein [Bacteroidia bacterium]GIV24131.1 MAG: hypothetical protein KatS3mg025_1790 [Bacteroidia bacterium]
MKEWLLAHDKLNTVILVMFIIWGAIAVQLWRLTRRIEKIERQQTSPTA